MLLKELFLHDLEMICEDLVNIPGLDEKGRQTVTWLHRKRGLSANATVTPISLNDIDSALPSEQELKSLDYNHPDKTLYFVLIQGAKGWAVEELHPFASNRNYYKNLNTSAEPVISGYGYTSTPKKASAVFADIEPQRAWVLKNDKATAERKTKRTYNTLERSPESIIHDRLARPNIMTALVRRAQLKLKRKPNSDRYRDEIKWLGYFLEDWLDEDGESTNSTDTIKSWADTDNDADFPDSVWDVFETVVDSALDNQNEWRAAKRSSLNTKYTPKAFALAKNINFLERVMDSTVDQLINYAVSIDFTVNN